MTLLHQSRKDLRHAICVKTESLFTPYHILYRGMLCKGGWACQKCLQFWFVHGCVPQGESAKDSDAWHKICCLCKFHYLWILLSQACGTAKLSASHHRSTGLTRDILSMLQRLSVNLHSCPHYRFRKNRLKQWNIPKRLLVNAITRQPCALQWSSFWQPYYTVCFWLS